MKAGGKIPIVLASASPRRAEILKAAGIPFTVKTGEVEERPGPGETAVSYVRRLAREKARAAWPGAGGVVLGADTVVVRRGEDGVEEMLEKPADRADARRMLGLLSGGSHEVVTGICLLGPEGNEFVDTETTVVHFLALSDEEIEEYVKSGEPDDKAGAYAIQGRASRYIHRLEGCYFNVVGLPVSLVWRHLRKMAWD
jgi:septum formation protein